MMIKIWKIEIYLLLLQHNQQLLIMRTTSYNDFSSNINGYFKSVIDNCDSIIVNGDNDEAAVLLSLDEYNSLMETLYLMSSPKTMEDIRQAEEDIKNGKGIKVSLDDLWK